ncbi:hypothetical protein [Lutibacter citreus]|uniref:hypothetical protein n=1 Tax=Lutibacter citreus TaxID=2138210 RepID=UPI000DBE30E5|nr:hypothetical protein [Lutibacter citreus]
MKNKINKDWYGKHKSNEELHYASMQWKSEVKFIEDEMVFLEHLLGSNYIDFLHDGLYKKIESLVNKISIEKKSGKTYLKMIEEHEMVLSDLISTKSMIDNKTFLLKHYDLQEELENYFYDYKELKKNIFNIVEKVMREKKVKKLIT